MSEPSVPQPEAGHHQRVGWIELFYDLVFVVVIERLTHLLHDGPDATRIWLTIGLTIVVWFSWFNTAALTNASGEIGPRGRPLIFCSMAGMGVLALGMDSVPHGSVGLFVTGYAIARTAVWLLWMRRRPVAGAAVAKSVVYGPGLSLAWLATSLVHDARFLVAAFIGLTLIESTQPFVRLRGREAALHGPHLVERLGLLLMIVLGESVAQIVGALEGQRNATTWLTGAISMTLLCALWWLIYEATMSKMEEAVERDDSSVIDFLGMSQLAIITGLILVASGLADAIRAAAPSEDHAAGHLHAGALACLCVGILLAQIGTRALTQRAFATNLGLPRRSRPSSQAEREERRAEMGRLRAEHDGSRPTLTPARLLEGLAHSVTYLVPVLLVWFFGHDWEPWVVVLALAAYVILALWMQGLGERRIRAYLRLHPAE